MRNSVCLFIDDDAEEHEIFTIAMIRLNPFLNCVTVKSGTHAVEKLQNDVNFTPDYIFLDLNMPGMDGKQCLAHLKKIDRLERVPIIIFSTSSNETDVKETMKLGSHGYVVKPDTISELVGTLGQIINTPKQTQPHFFFPKN
ncbi:response regulator [Telluribacter sp. SYSU D00476]|uniref:response regulator n=1 Tax=Telluribacter sp. SYSU D00476 TaxID=2811430 RepID=UPI001FF54A82|nr:response regulator [Telluribacter sp. SYSU D00476]